MDAAEAENDWAGPAPRPPVMRFDHLGVVVPTLQVGRAHFSNLLQLNQWTAEVHDCLNRVSVQFGTACTGPRVELICPLDAASPISQVLKRKHNILNHLAYAVDDIERGAAHLLYNRCKLLSHPHAALAFDMRRIQFFYTPLDYVLELIEDCPTTGAITA